MRPNLKSFFLFALFLLWTSHGFADITIKSIQGVSHSTLSDNLLEEEKSNQTEVQVIKIYGGLAGGKCNSEDMDNDDPCNNCMVAFQPCNEKRIYPSLKVKITFSVDTVPSAGVLSLVTSEDKKTITLSGKSTHLQPNIDLFVDIRWSDLCSALSSNNLCDTGFHKSITLGIKESVDSETFEEKISIQVYLVPEKDKQEFHSDCSQEGTASTDEGVCHFTVFPGDEKIFIEGIKSPSTFPETGESDVYFKYLRVYYYKGASSEDQADPQAFSEIKAPLENIPFQDLPIDRNGKNLAIKTVTDLQNNFWYYFRIANIDEAGNILYFSPSAYLTTETHATRPSKIIGFLDENKCFIATAAYGSSMRKETLWFKKFRDLYLNKSSLGKLLVKNYYHYSPPFARWIQKKETRKKWARAFLWPLLIWIQILFWLGLWGTLVITILFSLFLFRLVFRTRKVFLFTFLFLLFAFMTPAFLMAKTPPPLTGTAPQ